MCGRNYSCQSESGRSCWVWWQIMPAAEVIPLGLLELQAFQKSVISLWLYPKHHKLRHVLFSARGEQGLLCWGCKTFLMVSLGVVPNWREIMDASPSVRWRHLPKKSPVGPHIFLIAFDKNWCDILSRLILQQYINASLWSVPLHGGHRHHGHHHDK